MTINISPETKVAKISEIKMGDLDVAEKRKAVLQEIEKTGNCPWSDEDGKERYIDRRCKEFDTNFYVRNKITGYKIGNVDYTPDEIAEMLKTKNYSLASNGVMYSQDKRGVIPSILIKWFQERKEMRKKAAEFKKVGDKENYNFYNQRQYVQKILLNSVYGCLGLPVWRFYDVDNAEATTKTGVSIIQTTDRAINQYYKQKLDDEIEIECESGNVIKFFGNQKIKIKRNNVEFEIFAKDLLEIDEIV